MANISDSFIVCCLFLLYYIFLSIYIKYLVYGFYKNKINESPYTAEAFIYIPYIGLFYMAVYAINIIYV